MTIYFFFYFVANYCKKKKIIIGGKKYVRDHGNWTHDFLINSLALYPTGLAGDVPERGLQAILNGATQSGTVHFLKCW